MRSAAASKVLEMTSLFPEELNDASLLYVIESKAGETLTLNMTTTQNTSFYHLFPPFHPHTKFKTLLSPYVSYSVLFVAA